MIEIEHLTKRYGETVVVDDVSFRVEEGTIAVVVGTSGAGKSTLLRMINRLVEPSAGRVLIDGRDTLSIPEDELRHSIGYVIQGYGLFPHRTVSQNIATVPRLLGWDRKRVTACVEELLDLFQLDPAEFASFRMSCRAAAAARRRGAGVAAKPALLLMDEPFGALDPVIRGAGAGGSPGDPAPSRRHHRSGHARHERGLPSRRPHRRHGSGAPFAICAPAELLTHPAAPFVEQLTGTAERPFRLLSLIRVQEAGAGRSGGRCAFADDHPA